MVLITGGSRGIGAAVCRLAAARGFDVAVSYRTEREAAEAVVGACRESGAKAVALAGDLATEPEIRRVFDEAEAALGPLDHVVNNAGVTGRSSVLAEAHPDVIRRTIDVNVTGAILVAREAARRLSTRRGGRGGSIVNVSSVAAELGGAGEYVWYAASKGAMDSLTVGLSKELAAEGVRVNAVSPGMTETDIHERSTGDPGRLARLASAIPFGRPGRPDEIADAIVFLLTGAASYISGANIKVAGGR